MSIQDWSYSLAAARMQAFDRVILGIRDGHPSCEVDTYDTPFLEWLCILLTPALHPRKR